MENDDAPTQEEVTELAKLAQRFNNALFSKPINEEKMKELNMEYEQMILKENEIKNQKKKLLMEILKK